MGAGHSPSAVPAHDASAQVAQPSDRQQTSASQDGVPQPTTSRLRKDQSSSRADRKARLAKHTGSGVSSWLPGANRRRITFSSVVTNFEFDRVLGNDTVPGDGSKVCLGLGKLLRTSKTKLAPPFRRHQTREPVEKTAWVPSADRVKHLRKSMGDARYFRSWVTHKQTILRIKSKRKESMKDPKDSVYMPSSLEDACTKAKQLAEQVRRHRKPVRLTRPRPLKIDICRSKAKKVVARKASTQKKIGSEKILKTEGEGKRKCDKISSGCSDDKLKGPPMKRRRCVGPSSGAGIAAAEISAAHAYICSTLCHLCEKPIAAGRPDHVQCVCLASRMAQYLNSAIAAPVPAY